jgi:hypothetical protein
MLRIKLLQNAFNNSLHSRCSEQAAANRTSTRQTSGNVDLVNDIIYRIIQKQRYFMAQKF